MASLSNLLRQAKFRNVFSNFPWILENSRNNILSPVFEFLRLLDKAWIVYSLASYPTRNTDLYNIKKVM